MIIDSQLEQRWALCRDGQLLVDSSHPLRMYLGVSQDENKQLFIFTPQSIDHVKSSSAIKVVNGINGEKSYLIIELLNPFLTKEFVYLCVDLIENSRGCATEKESLKTLLDSFNKWQQLFDMTSQSLLSIAEIKGLLGELLFIESELMSGKAAENVVMAWMTHKDAARDFIYDDSWYEIKTVNSTSDYVMISSMEQLDHANEGVLVVYMIDRKSSSNEATFTLPSIATHVENLISRPIDVAELRKKLLSKGYIYHHEYDDIYFELNDQKKYNVIASFPRVKRDSVPEQVLNAKYELSIEGINDWLIREE
ncbi:MAG: PD-(D/E)XK motif protein [Christensenellaceae bacterium]